MKIRIIKADEWMRKARFVEVGHVFNVIRSRYGDLMMGEKEMFVKSENRKRLVKWYYIATHGDKNIVVYDYECEEIERVQLSFAEELKKIFKSTIG